MMLVGHMFSAVTGSLAGVICAVSAGHAVLTCCLCYSLGGVIGVAAFSALICLRGPDAGLARPDR